MRNFKLPIIVATIAASCSAISQYAFQFYEARSESAVAEQVCQHVSLRAQSGLSRDIQEQASAIFNLYSKDRQSTVVMSDGNLVLGVPPANVGLFTQHNCAVDGQPDMKLNFFIEKPHLNAKSMGMAFLIWFGAIGFFWFMMKWLIVFVQMRTHQAFTDQISSMFDLPHGKRPISIVDRLLLSTGLFSSSALEKLKDRLADLKTEITQRDQENHSLLVQVAEKERIEKEAQAMERLTKQVRHDIASPLSSLRIHLEGLEKSSRDAEYIENIVNSIEEILGDLETQEHLTTGTSIKPVLEVAEVLLKEVIDNKNRVLRLQGRVSIDFTYDGSSLSPISVDPGHFRRAIANLIQNAIEAFRGQPGHVSVACRAMEKTVEISIADDGPGIPPETLGKLRAYGATFGKAQRGRGLGLYHARTSIERWGGTFEINSQYGEGATVMISLPKVTNSPRFVASPFAPSAKPLVILNEERSFSEQIAKKISPLSHVAFTQVKELLDWYNLEPDPDQYTYIIDYQIARTGRTTGAHFVEALPAGFDALVCSSDYTNEALMASAKRVGYPIIPKSLLT